MRKSTDGGLTRAATPLFALIVASASGFTLRILFGAPHLVDTPVLRPFTLR